MNELAQKMTKLECIAAINQWKQLIIDAESMTNVTNYIPTLSSFRINKASYDEFIQDSQNDRFHVYPGIDVNDDLLIILVPLDQNGTEKDLSDYCIAYYTALTNAVLLEQSTVTKSTRWLTVSTDLHILDSSERNFTLSPEAPSKNIHTAAQSIQTWNDYYLDWFQLQFAQATTVIFKAFSVSINDLVYEFSKPQVQHVNSFLGLEAGPILGNSLPNLIFVADLTEEQLVDISQQILPGDSLSNAYDFGRPCPPLCGNSSFTLGSS